MISIEGLPMAEAVYPRPRGGALPPIARRVGNRGDRVYPRPRGGADPRSGATPSMPDEVYPRPRGGASMPTAV